MTGKKPTKSPAGDQVMGALLDNLTADPPAELERERYYSFTARDRFHGMQIGSVFGVADGWYRGDVWAVHVSGGVPIVAQAADEAIPRKRGRKSVIVELATVDAGPPARD